MIVKTNRTINWPILLIFTRFVLALAIQIVLASFFYFSNTLNPMEAAGKWFTVYGTIIDIVCLLMISYALKKESLSIKDLFQPPSFKDIALSILYFVLFFTVSLLGMSMSSLIVLGNPVPPQTMGGIPLWGALYSVILWPVVWAFAEQVTYQGYALPRLVNKYGNKWAAIFLVSFCWALQHVALPLSLDWRFVLIRLLSFAPLAVIMTILYLRSGKLLPFIIAHWAMDFVAALTGVLIPLIR